MSHPVAERILEEARRACGEAEVFFVESESAPVHFEANRVKAADSHETAGVALRVIKDGRIGFSSTSRLDDPAVLVEMALDTAQFGAEAAFSFPGPADFPCVDVFDPAVGETALDEMVALGDAVVRDVRALSKEVQVEGSVSVSLARITLLNTGGASVSYERSGFSLGFEGTVIRGEDMLFVFDGISSVAPIRDPGEVVASIARQLEWARNTVSVDTKPMPVLFMPTAVPSVIVGPLMAALNGKTVLQGTSPLAERLGERVVDARISITDDATLSGVPGSRMSDDEGVPSRRLPLVDAGVAANFIYDLQTAGKAGARSTGSGERSLSSPPSPSAGVLLVGEGDASLEEMIAGIDEGLIVERLLGAGQSNVLGGDFNANVLLGFKVEKGKVIGRVKDTMVAGNVYKALNDLIAVGSEGRWLGGSLYAPPIACANIAVAAQAG